MFEYKKKSMSASLGYSGLNSYKYNGFNYDNIVDYYAAGNFILSLGYGSKTELSKLFIDSIIYGTAIHTGFSYKKYVGLADKDDFDRYFLSSSLLKTLSEFRYHPGLTSDAAIGVIFNEPHPKISICTMIIAKDVVKVGQLNVRQLNLKFYNAISVKKLPKPLLNFMSLGIGLPVSSGDNDPNGGFNICISTGNSWMLMALGYQKYWLYGCALKLGIVKIGFEYGFTNKTWGYPIPNDGGYTVSICLTSKD
jgi:hypothetical protein